MRRWTNSKSASIPTPRSCCLTQSLIRAPSCCLFREDTMYRMIRSIAAPRKTLDCNIQVKMRGHEVIGEGQLPARKEEGWNQEEVHGLVCKSACRVAKCSTAFAGRESEKQTDQHTVDQKQQPCPVDPRPQTLTVLCQEQARGARPSRRARKNGRAELCHAVVLAYVTRPWSTGAREPEHGFAPCSGSSNAE